MAHSTGKRRRRVRPADAPYDPHAERGIFAGGFLKDGSGEEPTGKSKEFYLEQRPPHYGS